MAAIASAVVITGCGGPADTPVVSVAASLAPAFEELVATFERSHPDTTVDLNVGGSTTLVEQILEGAPVDVVATADWESMNHLVERSETENAPVVFATNSMVIGVPVGNPASVTSVADFERPELFLGACAVPVPCGVYAAQLFAHFGVDPALDTREGDVRGLTVKLASGDLDAAIVYSTDALASQEIDAIDPGVQVVAEYPIVIVSDDPTAERFVAFVLSPTGREILDAYGFGRP